MDKIALAGSILDLLAKGVSAASEAIRAASAEKEEEAFSILFGVLDQARGKVAGLRAEIERNKAEALKVLAEKYPEGGAPFSALKPTKLVNPDDV